MNRIFGVLSPVQFQGVFLFYVPDFVLNESYVGIFVLYM